MNSRIKQQIKELPAVGQCLFATLVAFCTYSCMYAVRKPFTVGTFHGISFIGVDYKIWLIGAQVLGYTMSKFIGVRVVSEMKSKNRGKSILTLIGIAVLALLGFWICPAPYNIIFLFLNGLPLGMIWGLVFSYLEGRKQTEVMGAGLSVSFILASGVVKSVGKWLMLSYHVSEQAMPFLTAVLFFLPLLLSVYLLDCIPAPTTEDEENRTRRAPMNKEQRKHFLSTFFTGILLLVLSYLLLMIIRDVRDNFSAEIWASLGYANSSGVFTQAEIPVALITLLILASVCRIKDNYKAFNIILGIVAFGFIIVGFSSYLFSIGYISGPLWMILLGIGLYLGYIPFNAFVYERMVASFRYVCNIGFVMYVSDSMGYLGSFCVFITKNFTQASISWLDFLVHCSYLSSIVGFGCITLALFWFKQKYRALQAGKSNQCALRAVNSEQ